MDPEVRLRGRLGPDCTNAGALSEALRGICVDPGLGSLCRGTLTYYLRFHDLQEDHGAVDAGQCDVVLRTDEAIRHQSRPDRRGRDEGVVEDLLVDLVHDRLCEDMVPTVADQDVLDPMATPVESDSGVGHLQREAEDFPDRRLVQVPFAGIILSLVEEDHHQVGQARIVLRDSKGDRAGGPDDPGGRSVIGLDPVVINREISLKGSMEGSSKLLKPDPRRIPAAPQSE